MRDLEAIVHPLVVAHREAVLAGLPPGQALVVFDIPLLFETGGREAVRALLQYGVVPLVFFAPYIIHNC